MLRRWLRRWRLNPLLALQYGLTIAGGMGTVAAVASLMLALGYQPLPYRDSSQLVGVWNRVESGASMEALSGSELEAFSSSRGIFTVFGGLTMPRFWILDEQRGAVAVRACDIEAPVFRELGIVPVLGRGMLADDLPASDGVVAPVWISHHLWQSRFGRSPSVIGTTIRLAQNAQGQYEAPYTVAGVLPLGVTLPHPSISDAVDVWFILSKDLRVRAARASVFFGVGRLRPGIGTAEAEAALAGVVDRQTRVADRRNRPVVQTLEAIAQGPARRTMGLLTLGVICVFLLAFANLAILMVSEGGRRRRELAIRMALGSSRFRLWADLATEQCALTLLSLGFGIAIASTLLRLLTQLMPAAGLGPPLTVPPTLNLVVLIGFAAFTLTVALLWSAIMVAAGERRGSARGLAENNWASAAGLRGVDHGSVRWRLGFLGAQVGIGVCLLATATLSVRTYQSLSAANLGPAPRNTVLLSVHPRDNVVLTDPQAAAFNDELMLRLGRMPGSRAMALAETFPPLGSPASFRKQDDLPDAARAGTAPLVVSGQFFRTLGIPILFGRTFDDTDHLGGEPVAVIDSEMAARNWDSPEQAVGAQITFGTAAPRRYRIVGIVERFTGYWAQTPTPTMYLSQSQWPSAGGVVIMRAERSVASIAEFARRELVGMPVPGAISDTSTMQERWQATVTRPLARMTVMLLLALLGLGLSIQGVHAVASATVAAQRHELAVRSAIGAPTGWLAWHVTRGLVIAASIGAAFGAIGAIKLQSVVQQWLGSPIATQAEPIGIAVALLLLAASLGSYVPARAAARANPLGALRRG